MSNQIPPHLQMGNNQSEVVVERVEDKRMKTVFFCGDVLTLRQKQAAMFRLGGRIYSEVKTVPNNFVNRCAITALEQGMNSQHKNLIDPKEHKNYVQSYIKRNVWNPMRGRFEDVEVGKSGASADLLFRPVYPVQELGQIANRGDGTVPVPNLEDAEDIKEAQLHYFPEWVKFVTNQTLLPDVLRDLEDQINDRRAHARSESLREVGDALLNSCAQYRLWGKEYVDYQTNLIDEAKKFPGVNQRYDEISERLFVALEITRQDSLITDFARNQNRQVESDGDIKTAIGLMAQILARQEAQSGSLINQPVPQSEIALTNGTSDASNNQIAPPPFAPNSEIVEDEVADKPDDETKDADGETDTPNADTETPSAKTTTTKTTKGR